MSHQQTDKEEKKSLLFTLIENNSKNYHIEYRQGLSNHLTMSLIALYLMDASKEQMQGFYNNYSKRLEPSIPSENKINRNNWKQNLGKKQYFNDYVQFFNNELQEKNGDLVKLLEEYLPILIEGLVGSALHGIILLGFGLESQIKSVSIEGLAYLAFAHVPLGNNDIYEHEDLQNTNSDTINEEWFISTLKQLSSDYHEKHRFDHLQLNQEKTFQGKIIQIGNSPKLLDTYDAPITPQNISLTALEIGRMMILLIAKAFTNTGNFFVLHGFTATHGANMILNEPKLSNELKCKTLRQLWRAFCAVNISQQVPENLLFDTDNLDASIDSFSWEQILDQAKSSLDEHVVKMSFACYQEFKKNPNILFRRAATRELLNVSQK